MHRYLQSVFLRSLSDSSFSLVNALPSHLSALCPSLKNRGQHLDCPQHVEYPLVCVKVSLKDSHLTFLNTLARPSQTLSHLVFGTMSQHMNLFTPAVSTRATHEAHLNWTRPITQRVKGACRREQEKNVRNVYKTKSKTCS